MVAATTRDSALNQRRSIITETVFSHPSKLELIRQALAVQFLVNLHVILVPEELSVQRVPARVLRAGHSVPESKIRDDMRGSGRWSPKLLS